MPQMMWHEGPYLLLNSNFSYRCWFPTLKIGVHSIHSFIWPLLMYGLGRIHGKKEALKKVWIYIILHLRHIKYDSRTHKKAKISTSIISNARHVKPLNIKACNIISNPEKRNNTLQEFCVFDQHALSVELHTVLMPKELLKTDFETA